MVTGTQLQIVFLKYAWWYDLRKMKKVLVQVAFTSFLQKNVKLERYMNNEFISISRKKNMSPYFVRNQEPVCQEVISLLSLFSRQNFSTHGWISTEYEDYSIYTQPSQGYDEVMAFNFQNRKANVELHELLNFDYVQSLIGKKVQKDTKKNHCEIELFRYESRIIFVKKLMVVVKSITKIKFHEFTYKLGQNNS